MLFNRVALIEAAKATIVAENERLQAEADAKNEKVEQEHAEWNTQYREAWLAALLRARNKLRNGQVLYAEDFPLKAQFYSIAVFDTRPHNRFRAREFCSPDLNNLIAVLSTIDDDSVTPSGLRAVGVTAATLSAALRTLGRTKNEKGL
jgi:hypothetical protein